MKGLRNKVILSGIVLLFAFIATIGSTYAWFTVSSTAAISEISLNVQAEENLLIKVVPFNEGTGTFTPDYSSDPSTFGSAVTLAQLQTAGYLPTLTPWQILPSTIFSTVTQMHDTINEKQLHYLSDTTLATRPLDIATFNNGSNGRYIQFQFVVMSQSDSAEALEMRTIRISATHGDVRDNVVDATRFSVWGGTGTAYTFGTDSDFAYSFDGRPNSTFDNVDTIAEIVTAASTTGEVIDVYNEVTPAWIDSSQDITTLQPNTPTLITVNIYVEGWDVDADNYVIGAEFNVSFAFTIGTLD
ncbi:MAG: hypothetical protein AB7U52_03685 [Candidatus Izemoplasmatales bacterium]